jgi:hypothetical protein
MPILLKRLEIAPKNNSKKGTGIRLPAIAKGRACCHERFCGYTAEGITPIANGIAPRSSTTGRAEIAITTSSLEKPRRKRILRILSMGCSRFLLLKNAVLSQNGT